jgi:hypothetical protein
MGLSYSNDPAPFVPWRPRLPPSRSTRSNSEAPRHDFATDIVERVDNGAKGQASAASWRLTEALDLGFKIEPFGGRDDHRMSKSVGARPRSKNPLRSRRVDLPFLSFPHLVEDGISEPDW